MKKCIVDLGYINPLIPTGVSIFAIRLLRSLIDYSHAEKYSFLVSPLCSAYMKDLFPEVELHDIKPTIKGSAFNNILTQKKNLKIIHDIYEEGGYECLFIPFLTLWNSIPKGVRTVSVVHDIQPFTLNTPLKNLIYERMFARNLGMTNSIIAISKYSESQLLNLFKTCQGKTHVVYNSIEICGKERIDNLLFNHPYILNVNAMENYKNQLVIVKAFDKIRNKIPHNLIFKAKRTIYWEKVILPLVENMNLCDRIYLIEDNYNPKQMNWLYSNADIFVNTSLMEGFGFTPIEAAINGTAVLTTKCGALAETTLNLLFHTQKSFPRKRSRTDNESI